MQNRLSLNEKETSQITQAIDTDSYDTINTLLSTSFNSNPFSLPLIHSAITTYLIGKSDQISQPPSVDENHTNIESSELRWVTYTCLAAHGKLNILANLYRRDPSYHPDNLGISKIAEYAAKNEQMHVIKWLLLETHHAVVNMHCQSAIINAIYKHIDKSKHSGIYDYEKEVKWLYRDGYKWATLPPVFKSLLHACETGDTSTLPNITALDFLNYNDISKYDNKIPSVYNLQVTALLRGHLEVLKWLHQPTQTAVYNGIDTYNLMLLALDNAPISILEWLLETNPNILNTENEQSHAIIRKTIEIERIPVLEWLHTKNSDLINIKSVKDQDTLIMDAVKSGSLQAIIWLHNAGVPIFYKNKNGETALTYCKQTRHTAGWERITLLTSEANDERKIILQRDALREYGKKVTDTHIWLHKQIYTAVVQAIKDEDLDRLMQLHQAGCPLNISSNSHSSNDYNPFIIAISFSSLEIVKYIYEHSDVDKQIFLLSSNNHPPRLSSRPYWRPQDFAKAYNKMDTYNWLKEQINLYVTSIAAKIKNGDNSFIDRLDALKIELNLANTNGVTFAMFAAMHGQLAILESLHRRSHSLITGITNTGMSTIMLAIQHKQIATAKWLFEKGAKLHAQTNHTSLIEQAVVLALREQDIDIIYFLFRDPSITDEQKLTILKYKPEIIQIAQSDPLFNISYKKQFIDSLGGTYKLLSTPSLPYTQIVSLFSQPASTTEEPPKNKLTN